MNTDNEHEARQATPNRQSGQRTDPNVPTAIEASYEKEDQYEKIPFQNTLQSPNDSGPYEEIDEDININSNAGNNDNENEKDTIRRPPLGRLPSYISLTDFKEDVNDDGQAEDRISLSSHHKGNEDPGGAQNLSTEEFEERLI